VVSFPAISCKHGGSAVLTGMRTVSLPADLCMAAEKEFGSLEPLLERVLRNLLSDEAAQADEGEQRVIEQRLRDLGYL
jgi:DNA polymerase III psi subunit